MIPCRKEGEGALRDTAGTVGEMGQTPPHPTNVGQSGQQAIAVADILVIYSSIWNIGTRTIK